MGANQSIVNENNIIPLDRYISTLENSNILNELRSDSTLPATNVDSIKDANISNITDDNRNDNIDKLMLIFKSQYLKYINICKHYYKLELLLKNYKNKNKVILDDLADRTKQQAIDINTGTHERFKDIELATNYRKYIRSNHVIHS